MADYLGPYRLGPNDENQGIYTGDARELARAIPDESVDLIFTDPVYQNIEDYRWLAETAVRVLKPDRACLSFVGIGYLPETLRAMIGADWHSLQYRWELSANYACRKQYHGKLQVSKTNCLWLEKGRSRCFAPTGDSTTLPPVRERRFKQGNGASWDKHPKIVQMYIRGFSRAGWIIFDPFTGFGTIPAHCKTSGRRWLAFEIDPDTAEQARERVDMTQSPLFTLQPKQAEMAL